MKAPRFRYDEDEALSCVCHSGDSFVAYLNKDAAIIFLYNLYYLAFEWDYSADVDIWPNQCEACLGTRIGLCEIHLIRDESVNAERFRERGRVWYNPVPPQDRLDFYVTRAEAQEAYGILLQEVKTSKATVLNVVLFNVLQIRSMPTRPEKRALIQQILGR